VDSTGDGNLDSVLTKGQNGGNCVVLISNRWSILISLLYACGNGAFRTRCDHSWEGYGYDGKDMRLELDLLLLDDRIRMNFRAMGCMMRLLWTPLVMASWT
jgi:hypothetical protein